MFASFSLTSERKGYAPTFLHDLFVVELKHNHKLIFSPYYARSASKDPTRKRSHWVKTEYR